MSITLDKIIAEVRGLPPSEQQQLRETLNEMIESARSEDEREDALERRLSAKGIITLPSASANDETDFDDDDWEPVNIMGVPVSEMIIRERR